MTPFAHAARRAVLLLCALLVSPVAAQATTSDLSSGIVLYPKIQQPWAVFAYDPGTGTWTALDDVSWRVVTSMAHSGYVIEGTAPRATVASTYRVVFDVLGASVEVFMTPRKTQRLSIGETTTLTLNLF
jgi:hypothetical protein